MSHETSRPDCPDIAELEQFVQLELDEAVHDGISRHLDDCGRCRQQLDEVQKNLGFLTPVRDAWQGSLDEGSATTTPTRIANYRVVRKLGEGGMGAVYEAEQENPRRRVALKVIRPSRVSTTMLRRFRHEMQVLGRLQHPGIAAIYEGGTEQTPEGARPYFAMELVDGLPLVEYARSRQLSVPQRLELMAKICDAVQHAHERQILHRDLKPGNILVTEIASEPQPKILDFGVARAIGADPQLSTMQTDAGQLVGTIAYMSPEQVSGDTGTLDTRSDVYALGVILYELLTQTRPYKDEQKSLPELIWQISHDDPTPLSAVNRIYRGDVETIVGKAMEKDRSRRYKSADAMAADIRRHLRDEPIVARPASTVYQLRKFARRNKALVGGVVVAFVLLILGIIGTSAGLWRAERARELAEVNARQAQREAAKANAVRNFLEDMLLSADPERSADPNFTVRQALDEARRTLDAGSLKDQPEVEAAVRGSLGNTYRALGQYEAAEEQVQISARLVRELAPDDAAELGRHLTALGHIQHARGDYAAAAQTFEQAIELRRRGLGQHHPLVAASMAALATTRREQNDLAAAQRLLVEAINICRNAGDDGKSHLATALARYSSLLQEQGDSAGTETALVEALQIQRTSLPPNHPELLRTMSNLAFTYLNRGKLDAAEPLLNEALAGREKILGENHPDLSFTINHLAELKRRQNKLDEAVALLRRSLEIRRRAFGEEHKNVATTLNNLAMVLSLLGDHEEAEELSRRSIAIRRKLLGDDHPDVARAMSNLGQLLADSGRPEAALEVLREALKIQLKHRDDQHPDVASCRHNLASTLYRLNRNLDEAALLARRAVESRRIRLGEEHPALAQSRYVLGNILLRLEEFEQAEAELLAAYEFYARAPAERDKRAQQTAAALVRLYDAWKKPGKAETYRTRLTSPAPTTAVAAHAPAE